MSRISLLAGLFVVSSIAIAETRVFIIGPNGEEAPTPIVISSTNAADYAVLLELWLEDTVSAGVGPLLSYQMTMPCEPALLGGNAGSVLHDVNGPTTCGSLGTCIDIDHPDWVFGSGSAFTVADQGNCDCPSVCANPRFGALARICDEVDVVEPVYLGEFAYTASLDARGEWGVTIVNPDPGTGGDSFLRAAVNNCSNQIVNLPSAFADPGAIISIPVAECFDDECQLIGAYTKYECLVAQGGASWENPPVYADVFPIGDPNGVVDFDDILCIVNGFVNEDDCPSGDIVGPVFNCPPGNTNGIDNDDILFALDAFAGNPACTLCP